MKLFRIFGRSKTQIRGNCGDSMIRNEKVGVLSLRSPDCSDKNMMLKRCGDRLCFVKKSIGVLTLTLLFAGSVLAHDEGQGFDKDFLGAPLGSQTLIGDPRQSFVTTPAEISGSLSIRGPFELENFTMLSQLEGWEMGIPFCPNVYNPNKTRLLTLNPQISETTVWQDKEKGENYAILVAGTGLSFVRITNPQSPEPLGIMVSPVVVAPTPEKCLNDETVLLAASSDVKVYHDHAYLTGDTEDTGLSVFDLKRLRGLAADKTRTFTPDVHYTEFIDANTGETVPFSDAHNISVNVNSDTGIMLLSDTSANNQGNAFEPELKVYVLKVDPEDPTVLRFLADLGAMPFGEADLTYSFLPPGTTPDDFPTKEGAGAHDAQIITYYGPDNEHVGKEIAFIANGYGKKLGEGDVSIESPEELVIYQLTNADGVFEPKILSRTAYPVPFIGAPNSEGEAGNGGFAHDVVVTMDQKYAILNDEADEVAATFTMAFIGLGLPLPLPYDTQASTRDVIFDISDLDAPTLNPPIINEDEPASPNHNHITVGTLLLNGDYRAGLTVFDISKLGTADTPTKVAYFDGEPRGLKGDMNLFNFIFKIYGGYLGVPPVLGPGAFRQFIDSTTGQDAVSFAEAAEQIRPIVEEFSTSVASTDLLLSYVASRQISMGVFLGTWGPAMPLNDGTIAIPDRLNGLFLLRFNEIDMCKVPTGNPLNAKTKLVKGENIKAFLAENPLSHYGPCLQDKCFYVKQSKLVNPNVVIPQSGCEE